MSGLQARRMLLNFLMLLLVAGLGGVAWWFVNKPQQGPETLYSGGLDQINLITLERNSLVEGAAKIRFEQQDGYWWMVAPRKVMANGVRLRQLFTFLSGEVSASYDSAGKDLAQYELQPGNATLRFNDQQYILGMNNAVSNNRYVLHDNKIKLVSESVYGSVTGDWVNFVSLQLLPQDKKVKSVQLPEGYEQTTDLANSWQNANAIRLEPFSVTETSKAGTKKVVVTFMDEEQMTFLLLGKGDEVELAQPGNGISYFVPSTQAEYLLPPLVESDTQDAGSADTKN